LRAVDAIAGHERGVLRADHLLLRVVDHKRLHVDRAVVEHVLRDLGVRILLMRLDALHADRRRVGRGAGLLLADPAAAGALRGLPGADPRGAAYGYDAADLAHLRGFVDAALDLARHLVRHKPAAGRV